MKRVAYEVTVEAVSPLLLSGRPTSEGSSVYDTLEYISGSSLRGAWIEFYKQVYSIGDEEQMADIISALFMEKGYRFENFYPEGAVLLPLTAVTCKQFPGFRSDDGQKCHGVKDSLLLYYEMRRQFDPERLQCGYETKGENSCGSPYAAYDKWVKYRPISQTYETAKPLAKIQSGHVAISPLTQTVEKGRLFFEQAIEIGERFSGIIHVPEDRCEEFEQLAEEAKHRSLRVGSKKTAGYGEIRVINWGRAFGGGGSVWEDEPLSERFRSFQEKCRERGVIGKQEKVFSLTLLSDAIFLDPWFRFRSDLTPKFLAWLTGIELPNAELVHRHIALRRVFGWNQQWHVAVDEQIAVRKGSSYLYIVQDEEDDETWVNRLSQLEAMWLGERTYEGYGRVVVCHPFHLQMEEV